jgi:hypothetical protein
MFYNIPVSIAAVDVPLQLQINVGGFVLSDKRGAA